MGGSLASGKAFLGLAPFIPPSPLPCDNTSDFHGRSPPAPKSQNTQ